MIVSCAGARLCGSHRRGRPGTSVRRNASPESPVSCPEPRGAAGDRRSRRDAPLRVLRRDEAASAPRFPKPRRQAASPLREARRREPAVVCQQPPVVGSTQFGGRQQSRPRSRPDCRNRGVAVATGVVSASLLSPDALAGVSRKSSKQLILISRESRAAEVTRCRASRLTRWRCAPWRFAGLAPSCGQRPAFVLARVWLAGGARA